MDVSQLNDQELETEIARLTAERTRRGKERRGQQYAEFLDIEGVENLYPIVVEIPIKVVVRPGIPDPGEPDDFWYEVELFEALNTSVSRKIGPAYMNLVEPVLARAIEYCNREGLSLSRVVKDQIQPPLRTVPYSELVSE